MPTGTTEAMANSAPECSRAGTAAGSASGTIDPRCSRNWILVSQVSVWVTGFQSWQRGDRIGIFRTRTSRSSGRSGPRARDAESNHRVASRATSAGDDHDPTATLTEIRQSIKDRAAGYVRNKIDLQDSSEELAEKIDNPD